MHIHRQWSTFQISLKGMGHIHSCFQIFQIDITTTFVSLNDQPFVYRGGINKMVFVYSS